MNKLTVCDGQGNWCLKGLPWKDTYVGQVVTKNTSERIYGALCKLKDYEKNGLSPDEVADGKMLTGWIPVSEQLPKEPREELKDLEELPEYIVSIAGAELSTTLHYAGDGEWYRDGVFYSTSVLAWMSLPERYEE